jgi:hypothetical protein
MSAPTFALLTGIFYLGLAVLGALGQLPTDLPHDLFHAAAGLWGFAAWAGATSAVLYARLIAVAFAFVMLLGLLWSPSPGAWLYLLTAAASAYFGYRTLALAEPTPSIERRRSTGSRRHAMRPIAQERRYGAFDRRASDGSLAAS